MKNKIFLLGALILFLVSGCSKKIEEVVFSGDGSNPLLTASKSGTIIITKATKDDPALTLNWTNPDYSLSTGVSSHDVQYNIELRKANTTDKFKALTVVRSSLSTTLSQGQINDFVTKTLIEGGLEIAPDVVADVDLRITAYIGGASENNATNRYSDTLTFTLDKPYNVIPDLWITGDATNDGWTNAPSSNQKFTYNATTKKHEITLNLGGSGKYLKFLTISGQWQPQWGIASGTSVQLGSQFTIQENPGNTNDPDAIPAPAAAGSYKLVVDLINKNAVITQ